MYLDPGLLRSLEKTFVMVVNEKDDCVGQGNRTSGILFPSPSHLSKCWGKLHKCSLQFREITPNSKKMVKEKKSKERVKMSFYRKLMAFFDVVGRK